MTNKPEVVVSYKGFNKDLKCRGFQYEIGKDYEHKGNVKVCYRGFHACEFPLDVFTFYRVGDSRYAVVEQSGNLDSDGKKSKIASNRLMVKAEISIAGLVKAAVEWTKKTATTTSGNYANSATSGDYANSATSGNYANSATSGNYANSATSGYSAHSATSGKNAVAANAGNGPAKAGETGAIFLVERNDNLEILSVFASKVGENGIEPDTWYVLKNGVPVETEVD